MAFVTEINDEVERWRTLDALFQAARFRLSSVRDPVLPSLVGEPFSVRNDSLRGAVLGINASTAPANLRAGTFECAAPALSRALDPADAARVLRVVGVGAASTPWWRIPADVTGRAVLLADGTGATLLGAALAGAEALGLDRRIAPLAAQGGASAEPDASAAAAYAELRPVHWRRV